MTESVSIWLENIYWTAEEGASAEPACDAYLWPAFFTIDGRTAQVVAGGLTGTAAVTSTSGTGSLGLSFGQNESIAIPAAAGQWAGGLTPIPVPEGNTVPGVAGVIAFAFGLGHVPAGALEAGHQKFNSAVQDALNEAIKSITLEGISQQVISTLMSQVQNKVTAAITAKSPVWGLLDSLAWTVSVVEYYLQYGSADGDPASIPVDPFDQVDFIESAQTDQFDTISVTGSISQARRAVGQGTLSHFDADLNAVAGYADPAYKHALVAGSNGDITEIWYPGSGGPVGQGTIGQFSSPVVALAGFYSADGYQHGIVGTEDHQVTELWWPGGGAAVGRGSLHTFQSPILALAAYYSADGYNNVIVATADNEISQLWWTSGEGAVGQGNLGHVTSPVCGLGGYFADDGAHHVIIATADRNITQFSWSATAAVSSMALAQTKPWRHPLGVGAYDAPAQGEQHAIIGMEDDTITEFHWTAAGTSNVSHDDLFNLAGMQVIAAFCDAGGTQHAIVGTASGDVHELWWTEDTVVQPLPGRPPPPVPPTPPVKAG